MESRRQRLIQEIVEYLLSNLKEKAQEPLGLRRDEILVESEELFSEVNKRILEYFREKVKNGN